MKKNNFFEKFKESKVDELKLKRIYFCPKCKYVNNKTKPIKIKKRNFICPSCHETIQFKNMKYPLTKRAYHMMIKKKNANTEQEAEKLIEEYILDLYHQGFSTANILLITKFPKYRIINVLNTIKTEVIKYDLQTFFKQALLPVNFISLEEVQALPLDLKKPFVIKLVQLGCTYQFLSDLLKINRVTLTPIINSYYKKIDNILMLEMMKNKLFYKYELSKNVIIITSKTNKSVKWK